MSKSQRGYTLVELMVVVGLIGLMTLIAFVSLNNANQREQTRSVADTIKSDLHASLEGSLANKVNASGNPAAYYGIVFGPFNQAACTVVTPCSSYSLTRVEKGSSFSCLGNPANCNTTILTTNSFAGNVRVSINPPTVKAIVFTETSAATVFWDTTGGSVGAPSSMVTMTVTGTGNSFTVNVAKGTGTISDAAKVLLAGGNGW